MENTTMKSDRPQKIARKSQRIRSKSVTSLHELPEVLLDKIFRSLRIFDLHNLRLSGVIALGIDTGKQLREVFLSRVRDLQYIMNLMDFVHVDETFRRHLPPGWEIRLRGQRRAEQSRLPVQVGRFVKFRKSRAQLSQLSAFSSASIERIPDGQFPLSPVYFVQKVDSLAIREITPRAARIVLRELPKIKELSAMPDYLGLEEQNNVPDGGSSNLPEMSNDAFRLVNKMTQLRYLMLEKQNIARLPDLFLSHFNELEELYISYNRRLTQLPTEIGLWLPQLRIFGMRGMRISPIPQSLVEVIVENCGFDSDGQGFQVTRQFMPEALLKREFSADRFPEAAARFSTETANPVLWWRDTIVNEYDD